MDRNTFIQWGTFAATAFLVNKKIMAMSVPAPLTFYFKDDGIIPNSRYPLLVYQNVFTERGNDGGDWLDDRFAANDWTNSWRWGVYAYHHYHSNTHEVLGCFSGTALLKMGGEKGQELRVRAGDILVIPAGVGHKCLSHSDDFKVLGAYPDGLDPDLMKGEKGERPAADQRIAAVKKPAADPFAGKKEGLPLIWK